MGVHHCPYCSLGFQLKTVLEYHVRNDHPEAQADYPAEQPLDADWPMAQEPKRHSWRPSYPMRHVP
jgi:hypothetical protein